MKRIRRSEGGASRRADPGQAPDTLPSGASLPSTSVTGSTSLEDVINTFDETTREKLQTLIVELGSGVAGRGRELNRGLAGGHEDLASLRGIASTLASRDRGLKQVIVNLDGVTQELARSDRRQQLGALIQNLEALMRNLADQESQLQEALSETNSALARTANGLDGTGGNLDIETGPNGNLFVVSLTKGAIYEIMRAH